MKILMLNYEFPPLGGGGGVASYKLAKGFVELGYSVDVVTTWFTGLRETEKKDGMTIYRVKVPGRKSLQTATFVSLISFPRYAYKICADLIRRNKYDLINTQFAIPTGPLGTRLSKEFGIKNILSLHGGDIYDPTTKLSPHRNFLLRRVVRKVIDKSDFVVAQSSNTKENAIRYYHPKKKIGIIPLPYEFIKFRKMSKEKLKLAKGKKYLISVGRLVKRKGYDFAIRTLTLLNKNVELLIVGDGPEKENLRMLAKELNVKERVHFLGQISEEKKFQYLSNSDVYFLSSVHEGFGIVLQEAMQVGLPIVATDNGGQIDLIRDGGNGFLIKYGDVKGAKEKIEKLLNGEWLRRKMAEEGRKDSKKFGLKEIATEYLRLVR